MCFTFDFVVHNNVSNGDNKTASKIHHLRWDKADLQSYYDQSRIYLSCISADKSCLTCHGNCSVAEDIYMYLMVSMLPLLML